MTTWNPQANDVFLNALELRLPDERLEYLDRTCADNADLRAEVEAMLAASEKAGSFLEAGHREAGTLAQTVTERPGSVIGPYKLLQQIGEGGMGTVYMAEQSHPVQRKVALKVIKAGMDSGQVVARFEAERQALALMDHPNIAKVIDAGTTSAGRPYFVMELVKGVPITQYCDENHLPPKARLELFTQVCQAVQHAHHKGVIHRDIKPTNVLVTLYDDKPVPKVIDFGVAKATGGKLTERTMFTGYGQIVGTLEYMSPEQARLNALDVDTRGDIYSLGVLLYELLTGTTPFDKKRLREAAFDEMLRMIREDEPPRPSTRLSTSEGRASIAANRSMEPNKLSGLVRGELDWIVMKALEKERNRRYETANGFALDIQRYLADESVLACPPSAGYRLRKFARRNKGPVLAASFILAALLIGIIGTTWGMIRATHAEAGAVLEAQAKSKALSEKEKALSEKDAALKLARTNELAAQTQEALAKENAKTAREQESIARHRYYATQINLAQQAGEAGQPARMLELLEGQRPKFDEEDPRGIEWYYLWRQCHLNLHRILRGATGQVMYALAVTPDGKTLASGSSDGVVRLWDVATGEARTALNGHAAHIWRLAISPDGKLLASGSEDFTVKLWDLESRQLLDTLDSRNAVIGVAFSPDGKVLAVGTRDWSLELWDVATRKVRLSLPAQSAPPGAFAFSPDGKMLATGQGWNEGKLKGGVMVWDVTLDSPRMIFQGELANGAAFSPDSKLLATCHAGAKIWSVPSNELKATLDAPSSTVFTTVAFSADGNSVFLGGSDRTVKQWEYGTGASRTVGAHLGPVHAVVVIPQSDLVASASKDGTAKIWHNGASQNVVSFSRNSDIRSLAFTPDSKFAVIGSDQTTTVVDSASGEESTTLPVTGALAASADANLLAANGADGKRVVWDVAAVQARANLPVGPTFAGAAFSRDGKTLATWSREKSERGSVRLWDLTASQMRLTLQHGSYGSFPPDIHSVAFSADGRTLAIATQFGAFTLWDAESGCQRLTLQPFIEPTHGGGTVEFSNDGKMLAAGDSNGTLRLWNVESGALQASFKGHASHIQSMAFSPDDKRLLSGAADKTARLWDVVTGQELFTFHHDFPVYLVAFAPDGKRIATASHRVVKLWLASTEPEAAAFRVELDPDDPDSVRAANLWGDRLVDSDQHEEAENAYGKAQARLATLAEAHLNVSEYRQELAYSLLGNTLLRLHSKQGHMAEQVRYRLNNIYQTLDSDQKQNLGTSFQRRAVAQVRLGRWNEAAALYDQAIELTSDNWIWYYDRGGIHLELGNWQKAAEDLTICLELPGASASASYAYALLCLQLGQKANYQRACTHMLSRFKQSAGTQSATLTIWASVLGPDAVTDWTTLLRLAEDAHAESGTDYVSINYLGAVLYRAGRFEEAAQRLAEAEALAKQKTSTATVLVVCNWLFQAMAQHQLGHAEEANRWFDKAVQAIDGSTAGNDSAKRQRWERQQTFELLRREATELLDK